MEKGRDSSDREKGSGPWTLGFRIPEEEGIIFLGEDDGRGFELEFRKGKLSVSIRFPVRTEPVKLEAACEPGYEAMLTYTGYRLELWAEGELADEDWPIGQVDIAGICKTGQGIPVSLQLGKCPVRQEKERTFTGIQGWKPEGANVHLGDCMPFYWEGTFHLFYLYDRRGHKSKWGLGAHQWAHIATRDLVNWTEYPIAVGIDEEAEGSICTGSVLFHDGKYHAFYAVRMCDGSPAQLTCAVSEDGIHFIKSHEVFALQPPYDGASARDPKVIRDERGRFHMFVTTSLIKDGQSRGCLAHLLSSDLITWETAEPLVVLDISDQPECSDYFKLGGYYYLVYSNFGTARYFFSPNPFGPWQAPEDNIVMERAYRVPKAAEWKEGRILFAGFYVDPDVDYGGTVRFYEAKARKDGSLRFLPVPEMEEGCCRKGREAVAKHL